MALSNDLISQFVKSTKDEQTEKKETVVYGTIDVNDTNKVIIDGSNISTPVAKTVVAGTHKELENGKYVDKGDRVTVMIKNHTATVTGNLTTPSASDSDLSAETARINDLETVNVTVQDTLDAHKAVIDTLDANYASIDYLKANYLSADDIKVDYLTAKQISADYATIGKLNVVKGDIITLNSEIANIDNLIFGSAGGNVIQTSFSNAVIAQLGDAQIKSAMIESVSAGKITAGDIITNNVRVKSEDGSLIISDETLQISDSNRVRVQIGKDASNDYSINIWDQNGNLMFSKGGITDAAIKEAIIRNDMVSDTANIHASKLDVDSLFEEINDSLNTIKSTKIYLDDEKQTLDVAFKSLTTDVTNQGETISSQGTQITANKDAIESKVWQQDIDTAKNEMSTQYSTLEQEVDSFKTTVSETYATTEDVENLEIGGRNYVQLKKLSSYESYNSKPTYSGTVITSIKNKSNSTTYFSLSVADYEPSNDIYTLSGYVKVNGVIPETKYFLGPASTYTPTEIRNIYDPETGYFEITQIYTGTSSYIFHCKTSEPNTTGSVVTLDKLKFEKGNKATDWTPAPEDIDAEITSLDNRVTSAESSIIQLSDNITANVTETTNLGVRMTTVEQTSENLSVKLENLEIGGRNLLKNSKVITLYSNNTNLYPMTCTEMTEDGVIFNRIQRRDVEKYPSNIFSIYSSIPKNSFAYGEMTGKQVTLSFKARVSHDITGSFMDYTYGGETVVDFGKTTESFTTQWKTFYVVIDTFPDMSEHTGLRWNPRQFQLTEDILEDFYLDIRDYKFELGNKPTDWTPAPEDVESDILDASKTATNYLNFNSSGLVIGDLTASSLGKNVLIDSDSVDIRNGDTTLASFGADYLYLAKNSRNAKIDLCNGLATMYHESKYSYDTMFIIDTGNTTEIMGLINPLCVTSVDDLDQVSIQFANSNGVLGGVGIVGSWLRRFGSNMYDTYTILDSGNYHDVMDSGWIYGGVIGEDFTLYDNDNQIQYRKIGKVVSIRGCVKPTKVITGSSDNHLIFTLPSGYRPSATVNVRCQGSGSFSWLLSITTSGEVRFARYNNGTDYVDTSTSSWLPFNVTFFID